MNLGLYFINAWKQAKGTNDIFFIYCTEYLLIYCVLLSVVINTDSIFSKNEIKDDLFLKFTCHWVCAFPALTLVPRENKVTHTHYLGLIWTLYYAISQMLFLLPGYSEKKSLFITNLKNHKKNMRTLMVITLHSDYNKILVP